MKEMKIDDSYIVKEKNVYYKVTIFMEDGKKAILIESNGFQKVSYPNSQNSSDIQKSVECSISDLSNNEYFKNSLQEKAEKNIN
ncbi:hypothetical protein H2491_000775 [Staphylococcus pseudintermedius]|uniref:hypothetical protein n=1 Tax=Staphylococcus pseudintermedius TaxID=283734 RepID=UPI000CDEEB93|nr:hypothetical protein [Staphylococcus pseudintermedius]AZB66614.1 hypothetical protein [Staphylococcus phage phiSP38-1]EGQ0364181.1 hypothetical protein [Staphylococcus pseudintermedius]EGQ2707540.1 hypothetical protein [Staphylococcus pseudintermedius]EGQ3110239.1 hypothetical protein [Staphylococcus pseudintermedius]EGQ3120760.1 hypothetical protein [Staphylococcus pseudintermedius]